MNDAPEVARRVGELILANLDVRPPRGGIDANTPLFDGGLGLDSFGVVELISALEADFAVQFRESDFREENFRDVGALANLVERCRRREDNLR